VIISDYRQLYTDLSHLHVKDRFGPDSEPPREKKQKLSKKIIKLFNPEKKLKIMLKQTQTDEITDKENEEKQFEPIKQRLDKVEKTVKQTNEDLSKQLELLPINKKLISKQLTFALEEEPKQLTFTSEEEGEDEVSVSEEYV